MLKAEKITCSLSGRMIVDNASLELVSGRVTALTGPNGAGKTTIFRILSGEMSPGAGSIEVAGRSLQKWPVAEISRFRGVLLQESHLNFPFTVEEVALLGRLPHLGKRETAADYEIAHQALQMMDMDSLAGRLFTTLSGGEKQRAQIARVLAQIWEVSPQSGCLLMLDEPTASLDLAYQHTALQAARGFAGRGAAVLVVLHDLNLAASYADEVIVLREGRIVERGTPEAALQPEIIENVFGVRAQLFPRPERDGFFIATDPPESK